MSKKLHLIEITPEELQSTLMDGVKTHFEDLKNHFAPKEPTEYLTRNEVAEWIKVDVSTVHNLSVRNVLQKYQIGGRILYKRSEVENAIVEL